MPQDDRPVAPVVVKKYANRRLYDTESSIYITLDTLAEMVRQGRDFVVYDAKTGDDITRSVLTQIIMEEETRGRNMLPTSFLRQLIAFYGDSMQGLVPEYLERVMDQFALQQKQVRESMARSMQSFLPAAVEETGRNITGMGRSMGLLPAIGRPAQEPARTAAAELPPRDAAAETARAPDSKEVAALREENLRLREELARVTDLADSTDLLHSVRGRVRH